MDKERLLGFTPWIELSIRRLYYSNNIILRKIKKNKKEQKCEL